MSYQWCRQGKTGGQFRPPKPEKFSNDEKQPTPQPAMRIVSIRKFKFSLNIFEIFIKIFLKTFKIF